MVLTHKLVLSSLAPLILAVGALACSGDPGPTGEREPEGKPLSVAGCPAEYQDSEQSGPGYPSAYGKLGKRLNSVPPPIDNLPEVHCLLSYLMEKARDVIGDYDTSETSQISIAYLRGSRPEVRFESPYKINLYLSEEAAYNWPTAFRQLAHEAVHIVDGIGVGRTGRATYLEEGIAECFSRSRFFRDMLMPVVPSNDVEKEYEVATQLVSRLFSPETPRVVNCNLHTYSEEVKEIRRLHGSLSSVSADELQSLYPDADPELVQQLTATFNH